MNPLAGCWFFEVIFICLIFEQAQFATVTLLAGFCVLFIWDVVVRVFGNFHMPFGERGCGSNADVFVIRTMFP